MDQIMQDETLENLRQRKARVHVFLVNGIKLQGIIADYDKFVLTLINDSQQQMVYKHAISTVVAAATNEQTRSAFASSAEEVLA
ncbi:MAG: RNA chaperone Hfq [Legionellaceae bacterium]|nr:RNA chaperone Hfq [Legionellaceae bacterium]|tara:strand:- start:751 stop:1002 length:252 start_codon:yes stop_codon:yes gene_type:complete